tara:strand:- start:226 stop:387 length:162 start_codon:yes stop_codon:yes gene_type:complete
MNGFRSGCRCLSNKEWLRITHYDHGQPYHHAYKPGSIMPLGEHAMAIYFIALG